MAGKLNEQGIGAIGSIAGGLAQSAWRYDRPKKKKG